MSKRVSLFIVISVLLVIIVSGCFNNKVSNPENTAANANQQQDNDNVVNNAEPIATPEASQAPTTPETTPESTPELTPEPTPEPTPETTNEATPTPEPTKETVSNDTVETSKPTEEIKEEEIPVAPIVTPTPTLVPAEKPEVIEEEDKKEVETPTANITIVEDVDLSQDLKDLWKQYPENHFNLKTDSYIYYQNQDDAVEIHVQKRGDGAYMISGSRTNLGKYMSASQFAIIKKVLETTVEYSDALYAKYIEAYDAVYKNTSDDPQEVAKRIKWRDTNTSFTDGIEKWKTLGNVEYKFELGRGVEMHYRAK